MNKFGPFERMGTRETQRRSWREAVARAAEEYGRHEKAHPCWGGATVAQRLPGGGAQITWKVRSALDAALSAPKPWTRPAKADLGKQGAGLGHLGSMLNGHWGPLLAEVAREVVNARLRPLRRKRRAAQRRRR